MTDREYWAQKKGQAKLDRQNAPMIAGGITPRQTKFETNKEKLRQTLRKALATAASFDEFSSLLLQEGVTVLLVEQNAKMALEIANRAYVLETGKIKMEGEAQELANNIEVRKAYLGCE